MSLDREQNKETVKEKNPELYNRHLQVNSVVYPLRKQNEWDRKAHSSPVKGCRRLSDQEPGSNTNTYQVDNPRTYCINI